MLAGINGDGRADVLSTKSISEGLSSAKTVVSVFHATTSGLGARSRFGRAPREAAALGDRGEASTFAASQPG